MTLLLRLMEMSERGCFIFFWRLAIFRIWSLIEIGRFILGSFDDADF